MVKKKKTVKAKEPIRLRFKELSNGNKSIYLDIYRNGKRCYEFLKLYLIPEIDDSSKAINANTLKAANAIKAQKIIELTNDEASITNTNNRSKMLLMDWMRIYSAHKLKTIQSSSCQTISNTIKRLEKYKCDNITMKDVDKSFCMGFIDYLSKAKRKDGHTLSNSTTLIYFKCLNAALNMAVKENIITYNPISKINKDYKLKPSKQMRDFLTVDELKLMIATQCPKDEIKRAYLFSCFCGLRLSDIYALTWDKIIRNGEQYQARLVMKKTQELIYLPLSGEALKWLPERKNDTEKVFNLPHPTILSPYLNKWAQSCGITKHITFHTARHTFATMLLTLGCDVYTVSKLLGHKEIKTTEIYAKIVDKKKAEAVNLVNDVFSNL